jgi:hypothetical protein
MFTAVVITSIGLAQQGKAEVTWWVSQSGSDVVLTATGDITFVPLLGGPYIYEQALQYGTFGNINLSFGSGFSVGAAPSRVTYHNVGAAIANPFVSNIFQSGSQYVVGGSFGHFGNALITTGPPDIFTPGSRVVVADCSITLVNRTIDGLFGSNLDAGPVVVWVANGTGDTISIYRIPITLVAIDIKPGSPENTVNLGSQGVTKVAVLGSEDFDATQVDPLTVELADATVRVKGNGQALTTLQDTNGDGFLDLVLHMETEGFTLTEGDVSATLTGTTFGGEDIEGEDVIRVVP